MAEKVNVRAGDATGLIIRHGLTALGLLLASTDMIDGTQIDAIVGAGGMLFGVGWSIWNKQKKNKAIDEALMTPPPVRPK